MQTVASNPHPSRESAHPAATSARQSNGLASNQSSVRIVASAIDSSGFQPSERMRVQSRWIRGESPIQPRRPPPYSIAGSRPREPGSWPETG